jgi:DNA-binding transcriptional regulator YhcF (GntR family)
LGSSRVELFEAIRRDRRVDSLSIRALAERHAVHRRTVRQALDNADPLPRKTPVRRSARLESLKVLIDEMLRVDLEAPRKQRHTARRVLTRLVDEHGVVGLSYSTVRDYVALRRPQIAAAAGRGFRPQLVAAGERALQRLTRRQDSPTHSCVVGSAGATRPVDLWLIRSLGRVRRRLSRVGWRSRRGCRQRSPAQGSRGSGTARGGSAHANSRVGPSGCVGCRIPAAARGADRRGADRPRSGIRRRDPDWCGRRLDTGVSRSSPVIPEAALRRIIVRESASPVGAHGARLRSARNRASLTAVDCGAAFAAATVLAYSPQLGRL